MLLSESLRSIFEYSTTDGYRAQGVAALQWKKIDHYILALILLTTASKTVSRKLLLEKNSHFWSENLMLTPSPYKESKSYSIVSSCSTYPDAIFVDQIYRKTQIRYLEFSTFWGQKQRLFPLLLCVIGHSSILPPHHKEYSISQLSLISSVVLCQ